MIEMVLYVTLITIITVPIISLIVSTSENLQKLRAARTVDTSAQIVLEKISREIRYASDVDVITSILGTTPGKLELLSQTSGGVPITVSFSVVAGRIEFQRSTSASSSPLTPANILVDQLIFDLITTPRSKAIKTSLVLTATQGAGVVERTYNTTTVLRGSY
jgi:hypothetical protein